MPNVLSIDLTRCTGCGACESACAREHYGRSSVFVEVIDERYAVPLNCRQCAESPCLIICPVGAIQRTELGAVLIAPMKCIGCRLCNLACPFGAIWFDAVDKISRKCDLCVHRLESGLEPACVATCPTRALAFDDPEILAAQTHERGMQAVMTRASGEYGTLLVLPEVRQEKGS